MASRWMNSGNKDIPEGPRGGPENSKKLIKIYNILANEADTVAPFLVRKMIANRKNGAKISWLTSWKVIRRFLIAPFSRRDIVSKYLQIFL